MRVTLQPAFVLHQRAYRETSLLLDVLTKDYGKISLVAKGVRKKNSSLRAILQPFIPLLVSYLGKGELKTLVSAETSHVPQVLRGDCLLSGFYLNELLSQVLLKEDPHRELYTIYENTLLELQSGILREGILRLFEKKLLHELGYGLQLKTDFVDGKDVQPELLYQFSPGEGFTQTKDVSGFSGKCLMALDNDELEDPHVLREIKRLMRMAIYTLLGIKQLNSRKLFYYNEEEK
jgi:DNA repair protein RecO (recombination protein O)